MKKESIQERLKEAFLEPPKKYGVHQIIHGGVVNPELVSGFQESGFAGIVGNISYGPGFPDDEEEWSRTEQGMRAYLREGMQVWIYDECGYPSGTARGYVTEQHPEYIAKGLYCYDYWRVVGGPSLYRADVPGDKLWRAVLLPKEGGDPIDVTQYLNENNVLYIPIPAGTYYLFMMSIRRLFDGTHATESYSEPRNYISLSDKAAARTFIETTHEHYAAHLSDCFGKGIPAFFTDEPSLISWNIRAGVFPILPWLDSYPADFESRYGYDFMLACVAVVTNRGTQVTKRRCDFWEFISDTVAEGYFGTIADWCEKHGVAFSGHMLEEERLQAHVYNYGSFYRSMRKFDIPGIDQLNTEPKELMRDTAIPIARFVASFADISGKHEVFTEFSDHCVREWGQKAGKELYYASVNWHLAMGVNNFTSYYSWSSFTTEDKKAFNLFTARCGTLLREGVRDSRCAVFYPEASMWDAYTPSTEVRAVDKSEKTRNLEKAFVRSSWDLLHRQIDFDYIDRKILTEAEIVHGRLIYRDRSYAAVIFPDSRVLENDAAEKILQLADSGVQILICGEEPKLSRETGEKSPYADKIELFIKEKKILQSEAEDFGALLDGGLNREVRAVRFSPASADILTHRRITEDGCILFVTNMGEQAYSGRITVTGDFIRAILADPHTGSMQSAESKTGEEGLEINVSIPSGEGVFFLLEKE